MHTNQATLIKNLEESEKTVAILLERDPCLSARVRELEKKLEAAHSQIEQQKLLIDQSLKHRFGAKSERYVGESNPQLSLFNEPKPESSNDEDFGDAGDYQYYVDVLNKLPHCNTVEDYEQLLPWHVSRNNTKKALKVS